MTAIAETKPAADPAAVGLAAFGMTTILLSAINAGLLPAAGENVVVPLAIALGGTAQLLAGLLEFRTGNTFGMTAFLSYGAFWWWFGLLLILGKTGVLDLKEAGTTIGTCLLIWGTFTLLMWFGTFRLSRLLTLIFLTLWIAFYLLGAGAVLSNKLYTAFGGWVGLVCGSLAMYGSFATVMNKTYGAIVMPVGSRN